MGRRPASTRRCRISRTNGPRIPVTQPTGRRGLAAPHPRPGQWPPRAGEPANTLPRKNLTAPGAAAMPKPGRRHPARPMMAGSTPRYHPQNRQQKSVSTKPASGSGTRRRSRIRQHRKSPLKSQARRSPGSPASLQTQNRAPRPLVKTGPRLPTRAPSPHPGNGTGNTGVTRPGYCKNSFWPHRDR